MKHVLRLTCLVSAAAFLLSVAVHVVSFCDWPIDTSFAWGVLHLWMLYYGISVLYYGMYVITPIAALVGYAQISGYRKEEWRRATFRGCPRWMKKLVYVLGIYTIAGFFVYLILYLCGPHAQNVDPAVQMEMRMASMIWMIMYGTATAVLYSGAKALFL